MTFREIPSKYHGVEGHLKRIEAEFLYNIPFELGPGIYVDLGTWKGRSATMLAGGIKDSDLPNSYVVTIDMFDSRAMTSKKTVNTYDYAKNAFKERNIDHLVKMYQLDTVVAASTLTIRPKFIFIDADHSYEAVKADFEAWSPKLDKNGIIAFHDSNTKGVSKFLSELQNWKLIDQRLSLSWWKPL